MTHPETMMKSNYYPEPDTEPKDRFITAGCGHEVYDGESVYEWEGTWICPSCMKDKVNEMSLDEWADLLGCYRQEVRF